ncbi:uncharacterized protein LOC129106966 isoform X5 [Anoplopoma fimbria]|uniref:uncharacterized protein LOC129106966 isoform X5 n=1 Tax=Anoplopoma fimbria TaxID=229290 RepID=UPI0023EB37E4|nr:uncharacterized protein LOC129106966 isoform X5 [Anoplopoma fimbria]
MANNQETPGDPPQSQNDPSQTSQSNLVLQPTSQSSQHHIGRREQLLSGRDKKYVPANTKGIASKNTAPALSGDPQESVSTEPTSTATSQVTQNLGRPGTIERRNIETVKSRMRTLRVKPLSKLVSSGHQLNQKPVIQQANSQLSNPSQYASGLTADGNHWMSQQLPEHRGLDIREQHVPERTGFSTLRQEMDVHGFQVKSDPSAVIHFSDLAPIEQDHQQKLVHSSQNQQGPQQKLVHLYPNQKLVQSVAETGKDGYQEALLRNVPQPTGTSNIRVRLVPSLPGRRQTHDEPKVQNPTTLFDTRGATSRTSYLGIATQNIPKTLVDIGEHEPNNSNSNKDLNPIAVYKLIRW